MYTYKCQQMFKPSKRLFNQYMLRYCWNSQEKCETRIIQSDAPYKIQFHKKSCVFLFFTNDYTW